ncbi:hypothetical protein FOMPIDRAFT_1025905, partial [Fomitopsis schrenkii]
MAQARAGRYTESILFCKTCSPPRDACAPGKDQGTAHSPISSPDQDRSRQCSPDL